MGHISDDGLAYQTQREKRNVIKAAFKDISVSAVCYCSSELSDMTHRFCSGKKGTLPFLTSIYLPLLPAAIPLFPSFCLGVVHNALAKITVFAFFITAFIPNETYLALHGCASPLQSGGNVAQLTGAIYVLKEAPPSL